MNWDSFDTWTAVIGALCAVSCALPGCFLLLRGMSMMGDAISHAVLPGLALAFLVTHSRTSVVMFVGAALVGLMTAVFTQWLSRFGKVDRGAAMGIVFTTLFAIGLILIRQSAHFVDLDPGCVLYGSLEVSVLDSVVAGGLELPRAVLTIGAVMIVNFLFIAFLFKELRICSFDPELATTLGINANVVHYLLMVVVAVTVVAAFEAVGSIIVISMLIVPPATAFLLTNSLPVMLVLSAALGVAAAFLGHLGALTVPVLLDVRGTVTSGMMAAASGMLFVVAWLFSPREGLLVRRLQKLPIGTGDSSAMD